MAYHWNWLVYFDATALGNGRYVDWLLSGAVLTLVAGLGAWCIALPLGAGLGMLQTVRNAGWRRMALLYTEVFRGVPLLVQMFLWYFVFPEVLPDAAARWVKREMPLPELTTTIAALGLHAAARVAAQVRAGIEAVPKGLSEAARALGFTEWQTYREVLLPIGARSVIPPLTSEFMSVFKNTSLGLTIGLMELTAQARAMNEFTFQGFEAFTAATLLYMAIALAANRVMVALEKSSRVPGTFGEAA